MKNEQNTANAVTIYSDDEKAMQHKALALEFLASDRAEMHLYSIQMSDCNNITIYTPYFSKADQLREYIKSNC